MRIDIKGVIEDNENKAVSVRRICEADSEIVDETAEDETIPEDDNLVSSADSAEGEDAAGGDD